ncbi:hypothetical protein MRB53_008245 [Persea americana]|uniref:Uncharacterized protein n=1 Tax=Persea americana TaxID=3435 RepID=A0ACC2ML67_PERAE|nr:hypothetical protein MRB53_008245 [Persea americana]|eukprot:TRINITY_DN4227_c3_g1_i3.p1 TRINITY_DN4227_c3_g1~~TRINITY_DN4227_c3_g1_i3.p1  ORF type:complete len:188 (+),score=35.57 TRINITY_DN4227_c3_g1_i3:905-1468(+)
MGIGTFPSSGELSVGILGVHGNLSPIYVVEQADLMIALGVRFNDQVTGSNSKNFAARVKIIHVEIDQSEIWSPLTAKTKEPHLSIWGDVKSVLEGLNSLFDAWKINMEFSSWGEEIRGQQNMSFSSSLMIEDHISPEYAIQALDELTLSDAIITIGVSQHEVVPSKCYHFQRPHQWLTSEGSQVYFG